jgi:hypothetical protein
MKKHVFAIGTLILLGICLVVWLLPFRAEVPTMRKYSFENDTAYIILKDNNIFEFNYSLLSSTIPTGEYKIIGNQVHCYDNSEYELKYVFDIKGDILSFNAELSSKLPGFSKVENGSLFE